MTAFDFTLELFCRVDDTMPQVKAHPLSKLHPSEAVTLGLLYAFRGGSFRAFDRWLRRELKSLFPRLPERTRLYRVLFACRHHTSRFLAAPTLFGVLDGFGLPLLHPRRCGRRGQGGVCQQWARIGKSNGRWIAGAKLGMSINSVGQVVNWAVAQGHVSDLHFLPLAHQLSGQSILLADRGFLLSRKPKKAYLHRRQGRTRPDNVLVCERGTWKERSLIETVLALFTQVLGCKRFTQRQQPGVEMRVAYVVAAYNLAVTWHGSVSLHLAPFAL